MICLFLGPPRCCRPMWACVYYRTYFWYITFRLRSLLLDTRVDKSSRTWTILCVNKACVCVWLCQSFSRVCIILTRICLVSTSLYDLNVLLDPKPNDMMMLLLRILILSICVLLIVLMLTQLHHHLSKLSHARNIYSTTFLFVSKQTHATMDKRIIKNRGQTIVLVGWTCGTRKGWFDLIYILCSFCNLHESVRPNVCFL